MEERSRRPFGTMPDGTQVEEITLRSGGLTAGILTYGGAVRTLTVPGRSGAAVDVALGFDSLEDYRRQPPLCFTKEMDRKPLGEKIPKNSA